MKRLALLLSGLAISYSVWSAEGLDPFQYWSTFRKTAPLLIQDIVVSPISRTGEAVLIMSEPQSKALKNRDALFRQAFGNALVSQDVFQHRIGFDGWARDIVVKLRGLDEASLPRGIAYLSKAVYGTEYGASYRTYSPKSWDKSALPPRQTSAPNMQVSASTLNHWLLIERIPLMHVSSEGTRPNLSDDSADLATLLDRKRTGVYISDRQGLVLLLIDRRRPFSESRAGLRRFTLDTDALLGALTIQASPILALVGRERTTSLINSPPLSVDTILTLSAVTENNLAQSYERYAPLAGRVHDPTLAASVTQKLKERDYSATLINGRSNNADWAPILLSRELVNTEFGQLLNITDQMLKGWSMANAIDYANFPYRPPDHYPDAHGVFSRLRASRLTFNWNTAGFGSWTAFGRYEIFTLLNTASLPLSYIPDGAREATDHKAREEVRKAEDEYGRFFAELRDPYLARVAQYTAMHLVFMRYRVPGKREEDLFAEGAYVARWSGLQEEVGKALVRLAKQDGTPADDRTPGSTGCSPFQMRSQPDAIGTGGPSSKRQADIARKHVAGPAEDLNSLIELMVDPSVARSRLLATEAALFQSIITSDKSMAPLAAWVEKCERNQSSAAECLSPEPGIDELMDNALDREEKALEHSRKKFRGLEQDGAALRDAVFRTGSCTAAWRAVVERSRASPASVHKTPSIVVSNAVALDFIGGHNIDGRAMSVQADASIPQGKFSIDRSASVLRLNPSDQPKAQSVVREFERSLRSYASGDAELRRQTEERITAVLREEIRPIQNFRSSALGMTNMPGSAWRGVESVPDPKRTLVADPEISLHRVKRATEYAAEVDGDIVVGLQGGVYSVVSVKPPPPRSSASRSFPAFQHSIESLTLEAAKQGRPGQRGISIVSDGTLSMGDLEGIRITAETRQIVSHAAGGGGNKPPPPAHRSGLYLEEHEPDGPGSVKRSLKWWSADGHNLPQRLLARTDVEWQQASTVISTLHVGNGGGGLVVARLEVPIKQSKSPLALKLTALFKTRAPVADDVQLLEQVTSQELSKDSLGVSVAGKIEALRASYLDAVKGDAKLRIQLKTDTYDFYVVEISPETEPRNAA